MRFPLTPWTRPARTALASPTPQRQRGQALVEFSLVLTPLLLILFSIIQLGLLFGTQLGLSTAARETARYASTLATSGSTAAAVNGPLALDDLRTRKLPQYVVAFSLANLNGTAAMPPSNVTYCRYSNAGSPTTYSIRVVVRAEYRQALLLPLISNLLDGHDGATDGKLRLGAREEMRVEGPPMKTLPTGFSSC